MKIFLKKLFLPALITLSVLFLDYQNMLAQSSLHDSLRHLLTYFKEQAKDDKLKQALDKVDVFYSTDAINDSLAGKLLNIYGLLNSSGQNKKKIISYAEILVQLFADLPPLGEHQFYAGSLQNLADLYHKRGDYKRALPLHLQLLAIRKKTLGEEHPYYAGTLHMLAGLYVSMGQYTRALPLSLEASARTKKAFGEDHETHLQQLNNLAGLYRSMGQYEKALPIYQQLLITRKKVFGEEHEKYGQILNNLAGLYKDMGEYETALPLFQQAIGIVKKSNREEHISYAIALNNLAGLYDDIGQYEKALNLYQQIVPVFKRVFGEGHANYAQGLNNLASVYKNMGQYDKALPLYQDALAIDKKALGEVHPQYVIHLNNLAGLYRSTEQLEKALSLYQQIAAVFKETFGEEHPTYAIHLHNMAGLYRHIGQYEKALPLYQKVLAIEKKTLGEEHPNYALSLNDFGLLNLNLSNHEEASQLLMQAADITLKHLIRTYSSLSEQEKMTLLSRKLINFSYLPSLLFTQHIEESQVLQQVYQNELILKGMVLEDQRYVLNALHKSRDSVALQLFEQWKLNSALIGKQLLLPIAGRAPYLDSVQEATNQLQQQLSRHAASFSKLQQNQKITLRNIFSNLQESEAVIEFIRFRLYTTKWTDSIMYAALVLLPKDSIVRFIPLFEEKQLQRILTPSLKVTGAFTQYAALQKLYGLKNTSKPGDIPDSLYHLIWKPLEKNLGGIKKISFAPVGLLHRIAFQALSSDATHRLMDKYELKQVLSTRSVAMPADVNQKMFSVAAWGSINYNISRSWSSVSPQNNTDQESDTSLSGFNFYTSDTRNLRGGEWKSLPGTRHEINSMRKLFSKAGIAIRTDSGAVATEEAFKELNGKSPELLHLATHGFFLPVAGKNLKTTDEQDPAGKSFNMQENPMFRSGLILAGGNQAWKGESTKGDWEDGILTSYEIAQMDLSNTNLLVLSACETALGDLKGTEGVIGLQRAFKMAGVKQMVISLWKVPDKETAELMMLFYTNWLNGQSVREALRKAQLKMKEKYPPYYWAAFVLVE